MPYLVGSELSRFIERIWLHLTGLLCMLVFLVAPVQAGTFSVCVSDEAFPPFTFPSREGDSQRLIRLAVEHHGWGVEFVALPWRRCLAGVEQGSFSAVAGVAATPEYLAFMAFPNSSGQPDQRRALGITRLVVYRPLGSLAGWDGQRFTGLAKPVLYLSGRTTLKALLARMGIPAIDTARASSQLAHMLFKGRGSLAIDHDYQVAQLFALPEFQGRFEVLPVPFGEAPIFLGVGLRLYDRRPRLVEAVWDEIGVLRHAAGPLVRPHWQSGSPAHPVAHGRR
ncbi:hypothetical protein D3879_24450 [Pseudomonas cavernicola]|uniref:Amino acid ABC transporter substrate-binding protein n=1 Tax=Pseudomonas cavernicola TaxID=2320866 RepID=A0A418X9D1_9PSED|nr:hypothetical protein D3879_24450 [Pseudomonas cavernicola]